MIRFGRFTIDTRTWRLARDGQPCDLSPRLVEILAYVIERDGAIVTRDELLDRFWPDVHVTENTLTRAIADIRRALDEAADRPTVIQTLARRGYRFVGHRDDGQGDDPFQSWVAGRLALETLDPARLAEAHAAMGAAAEAMPEYAPAHAGLANAHVVAFEATRTGNRPERAALDAALAAARRAVAIDGRLGEGWAVLGHALTLAGRRDEAMAALRRATALEPDSWRHHFRLALSSWGEERLRAADRTLALLPSCAAAHLLAAMVFVARGAWTRAEASAIAGAALQDTQPATTVLPAAGLHWMHGLVQLGQAKTAGAVAGFEAEISSSSLGLYGREFHWLAHTSLGFLHLDGGRRDAARAAFTAADGINPGAARNLLGLHLCGVADRFRLDDSLAAMNESGRLADAVLLNAALQAWSGQRDAALATLQALLAAAPAGPLGWNLGVEPMLLPLKDAPSRTALLGTVAARAA
jgi:DNA-binding winged helix-turn-helix (wHTH) protein